MKAIFERDACNYVEYDNEEDAHILHENFYLRKKLFGITIFRKRFRQDSNVWENKRKQLGFGKH